MSSTIVQTLDQMLSMVGTVIDRELIVFGFFPFFILSRPDEPKLTREATTESTYFACLVKYELLPHVMS